MKAIILLAIVAFAVAAPPPSSFKSSNNDEIVEEYNEQEVDGSYKFGFKSSGGYERDETSYVKNQGTSDETWGVKGSFKYYDAEGDLVETEFTAGVEGYVPIGTKILDIISQTARFSASLPKLSTKY